MATVKDRVIALCKERGISVNKLQNDTGIGNVVSRWDTYNPRMDKLTAVADYFGVPVGVLTGEQQSEAEKAYRAEIEKTPIAFAIGENEVILLETFRELSKAGKLRILAKLSEEFDKENKQAEPVPDSQKE